MKSPENYYNKEELGENEYQLYKDVHQVLEKHAETWATRPEYVLMSAVEGLLECYYPSTLQMQRALGLIDQQIEENSKRPETVR